MYGSHLRQQVSCMVNSEDPPVGPNEPSCPPDAAALSRQGVVPHAIQGEEAPPPRRLPRRRHASAPSRCSRPNHQMLAMPQAAPRVRPTKQRTTPQRQASTLDSRPPQRRPDRRPAAPRVLTLRHFHRGHPRQHAPRQAPTSPEGSTSHTGAHQHHVVTPEGEGGRNLRPARASKLPLASLVCVTRLTRGSRWIVSRI